MEALAIFFRGEGILRLEIKIMELLFINGATDDPALRAPPSDKYQRSNLQFSITY